MACTADSQGPAHAGLCFCAAAPLSESQRAMVASDIANLSEGRPKKLRKFAQFLKTKPQRN
jgi:hypothetical protein